MSDFYKPFCDKGMWMGLDESRDKRMGFVTKQAQVTKQADDDG